MRNKAEDKHKTKPPPQQQAEEGEPTYGIASLLALPLITGIIYLLQPNSVDGDARFGIAFGGALFVFLFGLVIHNSVAEYINRRRIEKNAYLPDDVKEALRKTIAAKTLYPEDVRKWLALNHRLHIGQIESEYWWDQLRPEPVEPAPQGMSLRDAVREATYPEIFVGGIGIIFFLVLMVALFGSFVVAATLVLDAFLPMWAAIMLAIPIALVGFIVVHIGDNTMLEFTVKYIIYLAIALSFIGPLMSRARENAGRQRLMAPAAQVQKR